MSTIVAVIKPILLAFLASRAVRELAVDLLHALAQRTDNDLDDAAVDVIAEKLLLVEAPAEEAAAE